MAATNFILAVYQKIWTLLNDHTPIETVIKVGNESRQDQSKRYPRTPGAKLPADFPRIELSMGTTVGGWSDNDRTFQTMDADFDPANGGWLENITQTFELKIVHEALDLTKNSQLELEVLTALRKAGPSLGFVYVIGWGYTVNRQQTNKGSAAGTLRQISTILITTQMQFEGAELVI